MGLTGQSAPSHQAASSGPGLPDTCESPGQLIGQSEQMEKGTGFREAQSSHTGLCCWCGARSGAPRSGLHQRGQPPGGGALATGQAKACVRARDTGPLPPSPVPTSILSWSPSLWHLQPVHPSIVHEGQEAAGSAQTSRAGGGARGAFMGRRSTRTPTWTSRPSSPVPPSAPHSPHAGEGGGGENQVMGPEVN